MLGSELQMERSVSPSLIALGDIEHDEVPKGGRLHEVVVLGYTLRVSLLPKPPVLGLHRSIALPLPESTTAAPFPAADP